MLLVDNGTFYILLHYQHDDRGHIEMMETMCYSEQQEQSGTGRFCKVGDDHFA